MRIALVTDGIFPLAIGGMQAYSANLARHLAEQAVGVDVYFPGKPSDASPDMLTADPAAQARLDLIPVEWPAPPRFPGHYVAELWLYSRRVLSSLERRRPTDWIYVQGLCGLALLQRRATLPPIALNIHGLGMYQRAPTLLARFQQKLLRPPASFSIKHADVVVSLGGKLTQILADAGVQSDRIVEIPVGIDSEWIAEEVREPGPTRRLVFVGRDERLKGIEEINAALLRFAPDPGFRFDFIGPIDRRLRVDLPFVRYLGPMVETERLQNELRASDVLVCPSYAEGMPTVILEAMASGLAIVGTGVGAVEELVSADNGWLIEPGDVDALYSCMLEASSIPAAELLRKKRCSLDRIDARFMWVNVAAETIRVLSSRSSRSL